MVVLAVNKMFLYYDCSGVFFSFRLYTSVSGIFFTQIPGICIVSLIVFDRNSSDGKGMY